jgi:hypothetical protein
MKILLLILSNELNELSELIEVESSDLELVFSHGFQNGCDKSVLKFRIIEFVKGPENCVWSRFINTIFQESETVLIEDSSVELLGICFFL